MLSQIQASKKQYHFSNRVIAASAVVVLGLSACSHRDEFLMVNPTTNQHVACHSGSYWLEEGAPQMRVLAQCFRACSSFGYRTVNDQPSAPSYDKDICNTHIAAQAYREKKHAADPCNAEPDEDVKVEIPRECLK